VHIRLAQAADAPAIAAIYNQGVATTATFDLRPRSLVEQEAWMAERSGAYAAIVIEDEAGAVAGFASLSPYRSRPAYSTTVEDSVYIDEDRQGQGLGTQLLEELLRLAQRHGFHSVIARIGGNNEASIALHESLGFELVGVEREVGRKFNRWIDVTEMQKLLNETPA
jgi:L-amino acid N-acyltransferase YncA